MDEETSAVFSDFAFIQTSASDSMVEKVAIVDVTTMPPTISIVTMRDDTKLDRRIAACNNLILAHLTLGLG